MAPMSHVAKFHDTKSALACLQEMREYGGSVQTTGLDDELILAFLDEHLDRLFEAAKAIECRLGRHG